ncbi:MAG UNVERIFIED_CONTAM: hypothetical protein LVQ98_05760 [Rickettsiaceae bacterium]
MTSFCKQIFTSKTKDKISIFGDLDPLYSGSVVKAIASSKNAYKRISELLGGAKI